MNTEIIGYVYQTYDYELFKIMVGNRTLVANNKLEKEIIKDGQIQPIIINKQNEVIDGQHRLQILKNLEMPVKFIINEDAKINNVVSINSSSKNWTNTDYLNSYADRGFEDYQWLKLIYENNDISLPLLICASNKKRKGTFGGLRKAFLDGEFKIGDTSIVIEFIKYYERLLKETDLERSNKLQEVLWTMYTMNNFDGEYFINKINSTSIAQKVNRLKARSEILRALVLECYNKNIKSNLKRLKTQFTDNGSLILPNKIMDEL